MPKPPLRAWFYAWAAAGLAAVLVAGLAVGLYVVSLPQILGFGTPTPFADKSVSLMLRQFAGGFLWGGAAAFLFAAPGIALALSAISLAWAQMAGPSLWLWALAGGVFGFLLAFPVFGAASGWFAEATAAISGAAALSVARQRLLRAVARHRRTG